MQLFNPARIVERRKNLRKTQHDLASDTGLSITAIYFIEKGKRVPKAHTLSRLAQALKCDIGYFYDDNTNNSYVNAKCLSEETQTGNSS